MRAIILAANDDRSAELRSLRKPTALITVNGIPLIERQLHSYAKIGIKTTAITVVAGYQFNKVAHLIRRKYPQVLLIKNERHHFTGTMYSLYLALQQLSATRSDEGAFISIGTCVYDDDVIERLSRIPGSCVVGDTSLGGHESLHIVDDERIIDRDVDDTPSKACATAVLAGLYKLDLSVIATLRAIMADYLLEQRKVRLPMETALSEALRTNHFGLLDIAGERWAKIRTLADLTTADRRFSLFNVHEKRCFIMDLDGTVYVGDRPVSGTVAFINRHRGQKDFYFVTNNTSKLPEEYLTRLAAMGIDTDRDHILSPLDPLIAFLKERNITNAYLLANAKVSKHVRQALPEINVSTLDSTCQALIVAYDTELTYDKLAHAALLLQQSPRILFLATHRDLVCPTESGFVPDSGCILSVLKLVSSRTPTIVFGKPNPLLIGRIINKYHPSQMTVVGDRLYTDKQMAENLGCDFICVLSGETTRQQIEELPKGRFPALIVKDLGELLV